LEQIGTTLQEVAGYTITSGSDPVMLLNAVRNHILPRLSQVPGVSRIDFLGVEQRAFVVHLKPEALMQLHLRLSDIVRTLKSTNHIDVAGFASDGGREWVVRSDDRIRSLDDLRHISIAMPSMARPLLLQDIATISEGRVPKHYTIHGDGQPAVALLVRKQPGANALDVVRAVDAELAHLSAQLPATSKLQKFYDQSEILARAKGEIVQGIWMGAALVVLVLYLFFGSIRPTLVVALTIPITLLATLSIMQALGLSLNIITMTALALVIGMIVDDAIIVAENIARHGRDHPPCKAALDGALEIAGPDASGTMTTLAAFLPLLLIGGIAALFMRPFGWTVSIALLLSLLMSLLLVPSLLATRWFVAAAPEPAWIKRMHGLTDGLFLHLRAHRKSVIGAALLIVFAAIALTATGRAALLPPMDEGSILVEYIMPPGTSLLESDRIGNQLEQLALADPDVSAVYRRTGSPRVGYQIEGAHRGEIMMKLKPLTVRERSADAVMDSFRHLSSDYPAASFLFHHPTQEKMDESFSGLPALFGVTIYGDDEATLIGLGNEVEQLLQREPDISNIVNNTRVRSNQLSVRLRPDRLALYGLQAADVRQSLRAAGLGVQATRVVRAQEDIPVLLRWSNADIKQPESIASLPISTPDGGWVPLSRIADITPAAVASSITRLNGERQITLLAEAEGNLIEVANAIQNKLDQLTLPAGYSARVSGQYPVLMHTLGEFIFTALAAIALIYMIMVLQFGSWRQPLAILAVIPLTLSGGLIAISITGHGIDISIAMGALTLIGIAVNNAIVLVDYANRQVRTGLDSTHAWQLAIRIRLRPVLMTSATTAASLLPLALGIGGASAIFQPFSLMVIGGLIVGIASTLVLLPVLQAKD
jgi:multidrug efflux pump subunit AcrB